MDVHLEKKGMDYYHHMTAKDLAIDVRNSNSANQPDIPGILNFDRIYNSM